jgi:hypothetical protein
LEQTQIKKKRNFVCAHQKCTTFPASIATLTHKYLNIIGRSMNPGISLKSEIKVESTYGNSLTCLRKGCTALRVQIFYSARYTNLTDSVCHRGKVSLSLHLFSQNSKQINCIMCRFSIQYFTQTDQQLWILTFRHRASYIEDDRSADLQMLHFTYLFNKYKY